MDKPSTGTGLHLATALHDEVMLTILLEHPDTDTNIKNTFGETALHTAARVGNCRALVMLLENKDTKGFNNSSKRRCRDQDGRSHVNCTALDLAAYHGNVPCVKALLTHGAKMGKATHKMIALANRGEDAELMKLLLRRGLKVNHHREGKRTLLHEAAMKGNPQLVDVLLDAGAKVNARDAQSKTPLMCAIRHCQQMVAEQLIRAGADVNKAHMLYTPLHSAAHRGQVPVIEILLSHGANVSAISASPNGYSMPHHICVTSYRSNVRALQVLLLHGAPIEASSQYGSAIKLAWQESKGTLSPQLALLISHGACDDFVLNQLGRVYVSGRDYSSFPDLLKLLVYSGNERGEIAQYMDAIRSWFFAVDHKYYQWLLHFCQIPLSLKIQSRLSIRRVLRKYANGYSIWKHIGELDLPSLLQNYLKLSDLCDLDFLSADYSPTNSS